MGNICGRRKPAGGGEGGEPPKEEGIKASIQRVFASIFKSGNDSTSGPRQNPAVTGSIFFKEGQEQQQQQQQQGGGKNQVQLVEVETIQPQIIDEQQRGGGGNRRASNEVEMNQMAVKNPPRVSNPVIPMPGSRNLSPEERRERARMRWQIVRNAFLSSARGGGGARRPSVSGGGAAANQNKGQKRPPALMGGGGVPATVSDTTTPGGRRSSMFSPKALFGGGAWDSVLSQTMSKKQDESSKEDKLKRSQRLGLVRAVARVVPAPPAREPVTEYATIEALWLVNKMNVSALYDEPSKELIASVAALLVSDVRIDAGRARAFAETCHASRWPSKFRFSHTKMVGAAIPIGKDIRESEDADIEYRLTKLRGRYVGEIKEKAQQGKGTRYDVLMVRQQDNLKVVHLKPMEGFIMLLTKGKRPSYNLLDECREAALRLAAPLAASSDDFKTLVGTQSSNPRVFGNPEKIPWPSATDANPALSAADKAKAHSLGVGGL